MLASEYYSLFARAGFAPIQMELTKASEEDIEVLKKLKLSIEYSDKPIEELCSLRCHIWAKSLIEKVILMLIGDFTLIFNEKNI